MAINVYVPNLPYRKDRFHSIKDEFFNKKEFNLQIVVAEEKPIGAWGLWQTFYKIVEKERSQNSPFFIFCEDDHFFTDDYNFNYLIENIETANHLEADILSGGVSWFEAPVQVTENLYWVSKFNGMQFTIIYNRFYERILSTKTNNGYITDFHLSRLSNKIFVMFPFISKQKDLGYSDVTYTNNRKGHVDELFSKTSHTLARTKALNQYSLSFPIKDKGIILKTAESKFFINTYVINLPERKERLAGFKHQMEGKEEFAVNIFKAHRHEVGAVGLWLSICEIIKQAQNNDEDAILICEDDHAFTEHYKRELFMRQVLVAGMLGAELLSGGVSGFDYLTPYKDSGLGWIENFWGTQFIIIYRCAFNKILNTNFRVTDAADKKLSDILDRKMVIFPFISVQKDYGYSDVTANNNVPGVVTKYFEKSIRKLSHYQFAVSSFLSGEKKSAPASMLPSEYIKRGQFHGLNLNCGNRILEGWYNVDEEPCYGSCYMDILETFPFPNDCMDRVYDQLGLNFLSINKAYFVLSECYRIMKPNGLVRLTLYSLQNFYEKSDEEYINYTNWYYDNIYIHDKELMSSLYPSIPKEHMIVQFIRNKNIQLLYSFDSIRQIMKEIGFKDISLKQLKQCEDSMFTKIENDSLTPPPFIHDMETITIEALK